MDPIIGAALIGAGANIFSAFQAQSGQAAANRKEMEFNRDEAAKLREWQTAMDNSRYQRTRQDLEAAGYNPLLGLPHPGSVPGGAAATAHPKSETSESSAILANTAKEALAAGTARLLMDKLKAETGSARAQERMDKQEADMETSKPGKALAWVRKAASSLGSIVGGFGAAFTARKIAGAVAKQPRIILNAQRPKG